MHRELTLQQRGALRVPEERENYLPIKEVGLALLRLEHLEGLERGDLKFELQGEEVGASNNGEDTQWLVTPWWPNKVEEGHSTSTTIVSN